jgi:hypothetical protein
VRPSRPALAAGSLLVALVGGPMPPASSQTPVPGPTGSPPEVQGAAQPCTQTGDDGDNHMVGTPGPDVLCGMGGNDLLEGLDGDDVLDGGDGVDTVTWESFPCCIRADLAAGTATGQGTDRLIGIENLTGSAGDDVLRGDGLANRLAGMGGTDLLYGGDGDDTLLGGLDDDYLAGEGGNNTLDGESGANVCAEGIGANCHPPSPTDPNDTRQLLDVRLVQTALGVSPATWRIETFHRFSKRRLWDEGYFVISLDTREGRQFEWHVLVRSTRHRVRGLLFRDGQRNPAGRVTARKPGGRGVRVTLGLDRLEIPPERAYYRWAARTIFTGRRCRPCFDMIPSFDGAFPQPVPPPAV